jgi:hypothetical protein
MALFIHCGYDLEKHTSYFNLLEQLKDPACPICAQGFKSVQSFLDSYLYEGVNDDTNWNRLSAAGGWCGRHGRQMEGFSDGLAVALFYRHEIRKRIKNLGKRREGGWFSPKVSKPPCPACVYEDEVESSQLHLFSGAWDEPEFREAMQGHPGLCIPHIEGALGLMQGEGAEAFKANSGQKLEALCLELDEMVAKSDYRSEQRMGAEGGAWKRALRRVFGPEDYH